VPKSEPQVQVHTRRALSVTPQIDDKFGIFRFGGALPPAPGRVIEHDEARLSTWPRIGRSTSEEKSPAGRRG
jgi:hypothetical protein